MTLRISAVWDEAWRFARAEAPLWLPVALACWGLPQLIPFGQPPSAVDMAAGKIDPVFLTVMIVSGLAMLFGELALAALVLRPGRTVADALRTGAGLYPRALGTALLLGLCCLVYALLLALLLLGIGGGSAATGALGAQAPGAPPAHALAAVVLAVPLLIAGVRLVPLWAAIVDRGRGGWTAVTATVQATAGIGWRLALVWFGYALALQIVVLAIGVSLGSVARLVALATGAQEVGEAIVRVVLAVISGLGNGFWAIFAAHLYRQVRPAPLSDVFE